MKLLLQNMLFLVISFIFNLTLTAGEPTLIDLEFLQQDFVIKTEQIKIPAYPDAFNPSIIRWEGKLLLSFRARDSLTQSTNPVYLTWLDENFKPTGNIYRLEIHNVPPVGSFMQDPRLIIIDNRLLMIYSNTWDEVTQELRRVFVAEVQYDGDRFYIENSFPLLKFDRDPTNKQEKNWVPFEYDGNLLLSYSIVPHKVFLPLLEQNECATIAYSETNIDWNWGELRGGTPALMVDGEYLAFFHCSKYMKTVHSKGKSLQHYFMGAYTFKSSPPFSVTKISPEIIVGKNFYHGKLHQTWKPLFVVFPGGFICNKQHIWVVYGRQDHEMWIVKINKDGLLKSLKTVKDFSYKNATN